MNLFLDVHTSEHGYEEVWVPVVVNRASMTGTAQLPKFEDDMYALRDEDMFLIPTAEVPVTNLYRDEMLDGAQLPRGLLRLLAVLSPRSRVRGQGHARSSSRPRVRQGRARAVLDAGEVARRSTS